MHFDLNLAIAYVCTMGLFMWMSFWFVPVMFSALVRAAAKGVQTLRSRHGSRRPPQGRSGSDDHWWGPVHHSH